VYNNAVPNITYNDQVTLIDMCPTILGYIEVAAMPMVQKTILTIECIEVHDDSDVLSSDVYGQEIMDGCCSSAVTLYMQMGTVLPGINPKSR